VNIRREPKARCTGEGAPIDRCTGMKEDLKVPQFMCHA